MDNAEFSALTRRAGYRLTEAELTDLKARFESATRILGPLGELDLGDGDLAVAFSPEPEPNRERK